MKILAIETATEACSAALLDDNQIYIDYKLAPRKHTQLILPMIEKVLAEAGTSLQQIDALAFGRGPGAFTGVRIATAIIQGLALAADKPVIAISTLATMAQQIYQQNGEKNILTALDARMNQMYFAAYQINNHGLINPSQAEVVISPENLMLTKPKKQFVAVGSAWNVYAEKLPTLIQKNIRTIYSDILPSAKYIVELAKIEYQNNHLLSVEEIEPIYLRNKIAQTTLERQQKILT